MLFWSILLFVINMHGIHARGPLTPAAYLENVDDLEEVAYFGDAQHRGHKWYDEKTSSDASEDSDMKTDIGASSASSISSSSVSTTSTSEASSAETKERKIATQNFRTCTPCPHEMLKGHNNLGIKWICGAYQRARRTFKSECMMRYRNCEDGTLFVKVADHRCKNDVFHGRHWFYEYKV